uniref:Uncharacterized protein n=1 Tax=Arundo donax TaxID=35708 RepID=A0A0A9BW31_ARUDO
MQVRPHYILFAIQSMCNPKMPRSENLQRSTNANDTMDSNTIGHIPTPISNNSNYVPIYDQASVTDLVAFLKGKYGEQVSLAYFTTVPIQLICISLCS